MTEACAACGADDELLFNCRHCERRFCERHELPHHACERFSSTARTPGADAECTTTTTTAATATASAREPPTNPAGSEQRATSPTGSAAEEEVPTETAAPERPMDTDRAVGVVSPASTPRSLGEWLGRQTYLALLFKVGGLALLINAAFYGGLVLTLYDPFGLL
jgi:hypothetical protein